MKEVIISIIAIYLIISILIGFIANKKSTDSSEDFFLSSRNLSWLHLGLTLFATWMSTFAFIGSPGFYFKNGVGWFLPHGLLVVASPMLLWFIGRKLWFLGKKNGYITPGDLLADFYQSNAIRYLVAIICLLALLPYSLIQLVGIGKVVSITTGGSIPYWSGIVLAIVGISVYTLVGGIRAIVWTDIMQGLIFGALMLIGAAIAISVADGVDGFALAVKMKEQAFYFKPENFGSPFSLALMWTLGYILLPHMWQRAYMAKSANALSKSIVLGSVLALVLIAIPSLLMGTLGIGFLSELKDSDNFIPTLFSTYLPALLPLLVLATFAAGMSTIDSQLLSASSVFVRDFKISKRNEKVIGRVVVLIFIFILSVVALMLDSMPELKNNFIIPMASKGTGIALLLFVPLLGPIAWQKASRAGALISLVLGCIALIILESGILGFQLAYGLKPPVGAVSMQLVSFVLFSYLIPRKEPANSTFIEAQKY